MRISSLWLRPGAGIVSALISPVYSSVLYQWTGTVVTGLGGFLFWLIAVRVYAVADVGVASGAVSLLFLLSMLSQIGFGYGLLRFPLHSGDSVETVNAVLILVGLTAAVLALAALVVAPLWTSALAVLVHPRDAAAFVFSVSSFAIVQVLDFYAIGLRRAQWIPLGHGLGTVVRIAAIVLFSHLGVGGILLAFELSGAVGLALYAVFLFRVLPGYSVRTSLGAARAVVRTMLSFSLAAHIGDLLGAVPRLLMPLVVLRVLGSVDNAYFYVAWSALYFLFSATDSVAISALAEGAREPAGWSRLILHGLAVALALVAAAIGVVLVFGDRLLLVFYGASYARFSIGVLRVGVLASVPIVVIQMLMALARLRTSAAPMVLIPGLAAVTILAAGYPLIAVWGIEGAAVALVGGYALTMVVAIGWAVRPLRAHRAVPLVGGQET